MVDTIKALCQVIQHEVSPAIEAVTLDLERARMEREDFRQGNAPLFKQSPEQNVTHNKVRYWLVSEIEDLRITLRRVQMVVDHIPGLAKRRKRVIDDLIANVLDDPDSDLSD